MKILMINSVCGIRSTGRICTDLAIALEAQGHEVKIAYGREQVPEQFQKYAMRIGSDLDVKLHGVKARLFDASGFGSKNATKKFIQWVKEYDPDIIHLHNIHGYYININILFEYLKTCGKKIFWSFYDCWPFTGHCAHFDFNGCDKWKLGCSDCKYKVEYPKSFVSCANSNYLKKKRLFANIPNLQLIVPSKWMASMVEQSYMNKYPVVIIPNGINISLFKRENSKFRENNGITSSQFMILGVSSFWTREKGIEYLIELAQRLPQEDFKVVIVGKLSKRSHLPKQIIHINATNNIQNLCEIYSSADIFVNPTMQETQGLTTIEAFACGTPAIVFNSGGASECVDERCGIVVEKGNRAELLAAIQKINEGVIDFQSNNCVAKALEYDTAKFNNGIIQLYGA